MWCVIDCIQQKDGGIRPMAIGATLRRLVSKLCCSNLADELVSQLKPKQLSFRVKGGPEAAVHSVRTYVLLNQTAEISVKVDVKNAFNTLDRTSFLELIEEKFPAIYPYVMLHRRTFSTISPSSYRLQDANKVILSEVQSSVWESMMSFKP